MSATLWKNLQPGLAEAARRVGNSPDHGLLSHEWLDAANAESWRVFPTPINEPGGHEAFANRMLLAHVCRVGA